MDVLQNIYNQINLNKSSAVAESSQRFFKHEIVCHGLKSAVSERIAKENFELVKHLSKVEIFDYCEILWKSGMLEESFFACNWACRMRKQFVPADFTVFERWIDTYVNNWASCDTFCNHTVGEFLEMYPEFLPELFRWAKSDNFWMRRAAAVSLIIPARKGLFKEEIFRIADILLLDKEDMVQKGYGWMLKVTIKYHLQEVFDYVIEKKSIMPRTALRYAIEKMPVEMKKEAMLKDF
jgi:3-methyladenine DNA glycosylase AlkD